jgi:low affinity Fe/Cu permease
MQRIGARFNKLAQWTAAHAGRASTFCLALAVIIVWAITGPIFGWSDTWQLIINTGTTIVTFLMVFLIQNTQNRDTEEVCSKSELRSHADMLDSKPLALLGAVKKSTNPVFLIRIRHARSLPLRQLLFPYARRGKRP